MKGKSKVHTKMKDKKKHTPEGSRNGYIALDEIISDCAG